MQDRSDRDALSIMKAVEALDDLIASGDRRALRQAQTDHDYLREIGRSIQKENPNVTANFEVFGDRHVRLVIAQRGSMLDTPRKNDDPIVQDHRSRDED